MGAIKEIASLVGPVGPVSPVGLISIGLNTDVLHLLRN